MVSPTSLWGPYDSTADVTSSDDVSQPLTSITLSAAQNGSNAGRAFVYYGEAVIQPTILAVGILTNIASVYVLSGLRLTYVFQTFLMALSISDLCASVSGFSQLIVEVRAFGGDIPFGYWRPAAIASHALYYTYVGFLANSAVIVVSIVIIRNITVLSPLKAKAYFTKEKTQLMCLVTFLVNVLVWLPTTLNVLWQVCYKDQEKEFCVKLNETVPNLKTITTGYLYTLSVIFGPILIIVYVVCFICIRVTLTRSERLMRRLTDANGGSAHGMDTHKRRERTTAKVTRTLLLILILDTVCTFPAVVQGVGLIVAPTMLVFNKQNLAYSVFDVVAEIFLALRPTYNFWLYVFHHQQFRRRCVKILTRWSMSCSKACCCCDHTRQTGGCLASLLEPSAGHGATETSTNSFSGTQQTGLSGSQISLCGLYNRKDSADKIQTKERRKESLEKMAHLNNSGSLSRWKPSESDVMAVKPMDTTATL